MSKSRFRIRVYLEEGSWEVEEYYYDEWHLIAEFYSKPDARLFIEAKRKEKVR
jgi:hypothetical protein